MKKIFYLIPIIALLSFTFQDAENDPKAAGILKKVSAVYKKYTTMKSTFSMKTVDRNKKTSNTKGTLWLKGKKFKLDYAGQIIYCNGNYTWTYNATDKEVTKEKYTQKSGSISPTDIFTIYKKDFKNVYEGTSTVSSKANYVIKMVPKKRRNYSYLKLFVEQSNSQISQLEQYYKNGTTVTLGITKFESNPSLADSEFEWNAAANPDVVLVDLTK